MAPLAIPVGKGKKYERIYRGGEAEGKAEGKSTSRLRTPQGWSLVRLPPKFSHYFPERSIAKLDVENHVTHSGI